MEDCNPAELKDTTLLVRFTLQILPQPFPNISCSTWFFILLWTLHESLFVSTLVLQHNGNKQCVMVCRIASALLRLLTYSWHMLDWLVRLTASTDSSRWMWRNSCILMNSMTLLSGGEIGHRWSAYITKGPAWLCLTLHQVLRGFS